MELTELLELKAEYDKDLVLAEAKVAVINDIIEKAKAKEQTEAEEAIDEVEEISALQSY